MVFEDKRQAVLLDLLKDAKNGFKRVYGSGFMEGEFDDIINRLDNMIKDME